MTRAALYMRCSTEEQATEGLSIEGQRSVLRAYCRSKGLEVVEEYVDEGRSGRSADRPEFQRMIATAKSKQPPWATILVVKWDRFARSVEDAAAYKSVLRNRCNIDILAVQQPSEDSATGRLVEGIMDVLAEFYSANLAEDVHRGMKEKAKTGQGNLGRPPFGYAVTNDDVWVVDEEEAAVVRWIYQSHCDGMSIRNITIHLRSSAAIAQFGEAVRRRNWGQTSVRTILTNPAYIGIRVWGRSRVVYVDGRVRHQPRSKEHHVVVEDAHPAIIESDQWDTIQQLLSSRAGADRRAREDYLLRGLLRCGDCGSPMSAHVYRQTRQRKSGPFDYVWHGVVCNRYMHIGACSRQGIAYERLETMVLEAVRLAATDPRNLTFAPPETRQSSDAKRLEAKLRDIPARVDRQVQAYEAGAISLDDLRTARERLKAEEESIRSQLAAKPTQPDLLAFASRLDEVYRIVSSDASLHVRRKALLRVMSHVTWSKTQNRIEIVWRYPS